MPAGGHFLIQMGAAGANGAALPTPDAVATPAFNLAAAGGQVYLLVAAPPDHDHRGPVPAPRRGRHGRRRTGSTSFETAATTAAATTTSSLNRSAAGADTDNNTDDFALAAPTPQNAGTGDPAADPPTEHTHRRDPGHRQRHLAVRRRDR